VVRNVSLRFDKCDKTFENRKDFKTHKSMHRSNKEIFYCDKCEKHFNEEWKMRAHRNGHNENENKCNLCSKAFRSAETKEKYVKICHENVKLYCYYFNNKKICPYDEECVLFHIESPACRYGALCDGLMCMFRHEYDDVETSETFEKELEKTDKPIEIVDVEEQDESQNNESVIIEDNPNKTFINPSQADRVLDSEMFKCEKCNFHSSTRFRLIIHKESYHNWCPTCYSTFKDQEELKKRKKDYSQ
jgi:hypothetical protein